MEHKIFVEGNYLFIINEQGALLDYATRKVEINRVALNSKVYAITYNDYPIIPAISVDSILKKDGSNYTLDEFETFRLKISNGCSNAVQPIGAKIMPTGQTSTSRTGDDGDLMEGRGENFLTLSTNNPFGNPNRFTDLIGAQDYNDQIVIDWSTYNGEQVLGWYKGDFPIEEWDDAIINSLVLSVANFTEWRIPNINELHSIIYHQEGAWEYPPFNQTGLTVVWSSTRYSAGAGNALTAWSDSRILPRPKTSTSYSLRVRNFTKNELGL